MSRDNHGRFQKGHSGNPNGRPRKPRREISTRRIRDEFFDAGDMPITIIDKGKRKTVSARTAIYRQLALKAASGDMQAIKEYTKTEGKLTQEFVDQQIELLETLLETEKRCKESPEEVTEKLLDIMRRTRALLAPEFRP